MSSQPLHSTMVSLKKEKWLFLHPLHRKNPGKIESDYSLFKRLDRAQSVFSEYSQPSKMQTLNNLFKKSGPQEGRSRALQEVYLWKQIACFIFLTWLCICMCNLLKGNVILFPAIYPCQLSCSTPWSHIHIQAILSDSDSVSGCNILSQSCYRCSLNSPFELCNSQTVIGMAS